MEVKPLGMIHVVLKAYDNEHYTIERPSSLVQNIIFGNMYIEHVGLMKVVNHKTGHVCEVDFKKRGWSAKDHDRVDGKVMDKNGKAFFKLQGKWSEGITANGLPGSGHPETEFTVWQSFAPPENQPQMYNFTNFTLQLNYLRPGQEHVLPPTDSRFRPDQRALENGELDKASAEKVRLEEKQRARRKQMEAAGEHHHAFYFETYKCELTGETAYRLKGDYWQDKKEKNWSKLPDLF
jgi:hypothetical protein